MGVFRTIIFLIFATWLGCGSALAEKRVALVIGNSAYKNVPRLTNPANDASLVAEMFKNAGFDAITTKLNLNVGEMRKTLREFGASTRDADMAVIYYAGHGIELDGNNYLIPTDATLETDADVLDETLPLDRVLFAVEPAKRLRLIILDACRDNPFTKTMKRTIAARAVGRGLAKVEPTSPNTLIAFAAKAGSTAFDGDDRGSPFAMALVKHLAVPGLDIRKAFGYVRDDVLKATNNRQEPYVYGSLGGEDVLLVPATPVMAGPQPNPEDAVRRDYELALQLGTRDGWNAFLARYPTGFYADLAGGQLNKIAAEEARAPAAERARLAEQEKARLAAEGAKKAEQEKAAAEAKAAEEARIAAEKAKQIEAEKAAAAERARAAAERAAAEKLAADKAAAEKAATEKAAAEQASDERAAAEKAAAEKRTAEAKATAEKAVAEAKSVEIEPAAGPASSTPKQEVSGLIAALTPEPSRQSSLSATEIIRLVQAELRRVGCLTEAVSDQWTDAARRSLERFNRYSGLKLDTKAASSGVLDAVKSRTARVCPLLCDRGFRAERGSCVRIACKTGYRLGDNDACEKIGSKTQATKLQVPGPGAEKVRGEHAADDEGAILGAQVDRSALPAGPAPPDLPRRGPRVTQGGHTSCGPKGCQLVPKGCHAVRNVLGGHDLGGKIFCP
jgi:uncharacterized caspase-like protein